MTFATAEKYADVVSQRMLAERTTLATDWLSRLKELLTVDANEVFPSDQLLDHIPILIGEIASYLRAPEDEEIAANAAVIDKARELGRLRHEQSASVHQLLREYEILAEILERFVVEETERLGLQPTASEGFEVVRRLTRSIRALMRTTVDTFVSEYTATIEERNERLRTFSRMTSHELRSPIGTILFAASILRLDSVRGDPARLSKIAHTVQSNAERLSWLVANLERMAHLSEPVDVPNQQHVELHTIATEVARQLEEMAASRSVAIRVSDALPSLVLDPARLELILLNLVSNAIKYSDPKKTDGFVEIGCCEDDPAAPTCTIFVRDNGLGIPEADQPTIFERFFRAHPHLDGRLGVSGSGLGLAIAAECAEALGGTIRCESGVNKGTTFFITLPRHASTKEQLPAAQRSS